MVGFQTKLKHGEQVRLFRTIPGLAATPSSPGSAACTATPSSTRPSCSTRTLRLKAEPRLRFAGQITGCEGYVESAAIGLLAGRFAAAERRGEPLAPPPPTTALGALLGHITGGHLETIDAGPRSFQPMNVNFGLFPPMTAPTRNRTASGCAARPSPSPGSARCAPARLADFDGWRAGAARAAAE